MYQIGTVLIAKRQDPEALTVRRTQQEEVIVENIRKWAQWAAEPIDAALLEEILHLFQPVKNIGHVEGLAINN